MTDRYLEPHQAQKSPPSEFEIQLGDTIEAAYAAGIHDLEGVVDHLNAQGPPDPADRTWTTESFTALMAELGR